nr:MAG TPA: type I neck protein [Caudoviricetes sp.]DAV35652.1 MAG TPA: type I neck protein [Caudoviricetes sp.]
MITFRQKGDFSKVTHYFEKLKETAKLGVLDKYGREGVAALASATPTETGLTASSWSYTIERQNGSVAIVFENSNINKGVPIAIILQYGHGTGTGGWVQGRDYINPAIQPIFDKMADEAWKEVTKI